MVAHRQAVPVFPPRGRGARGSTLRGRVAVAVYIVAVIEESVLRVLLFTVLVDTVLLVDNGGRFRPRRLVSKVVFGTRRCLGRADVSSSAVSCFCFGLHRRSPGCPRGCLFCCWTNFLGGFPARWWLLPVAFQEVINHASVEVVASGVRCICFCQ